MKVEMLELDGGRPYQDIINKFLTKLDELGHTFKDITFFLHNTTAYAVIIYEEVTDE